MPYISICLLLLLRRSLAFDLFLFCLSFFSHVIAPLYAGQWRAYGSPRLSCHAHRRCRNLSKVRLPNAGFQIARCLRTRTKIQSSAEIKRIVSRPPNASCIFQRVIRYFVGKYLVCNLVSANCVVAHGNVPPGNYSENSSRRRASLHHAGANVSGPLPSLFAFCPRLESRTRKVTWPIIDHARSCWPLRFGRITFRNWPPPRLISPPFPRHLKLPLPDTPFCICGVTFLTNIIP